MRMPVFRRSVDIRGSITIERNKLPLRNAMIYKLKVLCASLSLCFLCSCVEKNVTSRPNSTTSVAISVHASTLMTAHLAGADPVSDLQLALVSIITSNTATNYRIKCRHFGELYNALTRCSPNEKSVVIKLSPLSSLQPQKTVADGRRCLPEGRPLRRRPKAVLSTPSFQRWVWRARRPCHCAGGSSCR